LIIRFLDTGYEADESEPHLWFHKVLVSFPMPTFTALALPNIAFIKYRLARIDRINREGRFAGVFFRRCTFSSKKAKNRL
jgi:hypothetical protein